MPPIDELLAVMARLRDPESGCAWDLEQSFRSIAPYTLEEAYEVVDAIERGSLDELRDELGDLLLQVVFHARMAQEVGAFGFDDVARAIVDKMVRRHPHVFGDARIDDPVELKRRWEAEKARERAARAASATVAANGHAGATPPSALDGVAGALPALVRAAKLQSRAARVGFDWPDPEPVRAKVLEELDEVAAASGPDEIEDELGDLLFSVVNLARHVGADPETALRRACAKFERRFRTVERLAGERGTAPDALDLAELDALWDEAKARERAIRAEDPTGG